MTAPSSTGRRHRAAPERRRRAGTVTGLGGAQRRSVVLAAAVMAAGVWVAGATPAMASTPPAASPTSASPAPASPATTVAGAAAADAGALAADQAEAAQLASQIRFQGQQIEQDAEQADAASIRQVQVTAQLADARRRSATTDAELATARVLLANQALAAYTSGGHTQLSPTVHALTVSDPGLIGAYGEIVAGAQRDAITVYRQLRRQQAAEQVRLTAAVSEAAGAAAQLRSDQAAAQHAADAERATLAGIQGRMATLVAAAEAAQAQATAALVQQSLAQHGQAPPPTVAPTTAPAAAATTTAAPQPSAAPAGHPVTTGAPATTTATVPATAAPTTARPVATTTPVTSPPTTAPTGSPRPQAPGAQVAIAYAEAQLGKPYQWGGAGPQTFDCSGLVMRAWGAAGVSFPHLAQDQYDMTQRISLNQLLPGDLVFFGTPSNVYHVGIYLGGGNMIDAPATGQNVSIQNMYWADLLGGGRVVS